MESGRGHAPDTHRGNSHDHLIGHQPRSGAQIRIHPRTSAGIGSRNRRLFVPESAPLRNQEVGGSSPPSSITRGKTPPLLVLQCRKNIETASAPRGQDRGDYTGQHGDERERDQRPERDTERDPLI